MGRRKADSERRVAALNVRLSPKEREAFERAADDKGVSVGAWLRMVGLERVAFETGTGLHKRFDAATIEKLENDNVLKGSA